MFDPGRFLTHSLQDPRVARIMAAGLDAVEPGKVVREYLEAHRLPAYHRIFLLGLGKAAEPMTMAAAAFVGDDAEGLVITKRSTAVSTGRLRQLEAGHPVPDERSLRAGEAALELASRVEADDLLLCLISGGGSALAAAPRAGISLEDLQEVTRRLLAAGADIQEVNAVRRPLDRIKAGGLRRACKGAMLSLILSDVIGDRLEDIASGPTAPGSEGPQQALGILKKYDLESAIPKSIHRFILERGSQSARAGPGLGSSPAVNVVIANNRTALEAAREGADREGFSTRLLDTPVRGEASAVGTALAGELRAELQASTRPFCLIGGGETTVTVRGAGKGGRNQELALAGVDPLAGLDSIMLVALATDGDDGPTEAAGAVVTGETQARAERLGLSAASHLAGNDSYAFFAALDDLLKPGYTGTNVNDLILSFAF
jgi:hydroxypyruvate reductase